MGGSRDDICQKKKKKRKNEKTETKVAICVKVCESVRVCARE